MRSQVTLQINLAPADALYARSLLSHQLKAFAGQCTEVLLVVDLHRTRSRQFTPTNFGAHRLKLSEAIESVTRECARSIRCVEVDYSAEAISRVSAFFLTQGGRIPPKDFRGGPYYSYFFGVFSCRTDYVLHVDADMIFGGRSQTWVEEALNVLRERSESVICCCPLPGPPTSSFASEQITSSPNTAFNRKFTTRVFLTSRETLRQRLTVQLVPSRWRRLQAMVRGRWPYELPELVITRQMRNENQFRCDLLGQPPGMWSLHPLSKTPSFCELLPQILASVEAGQIPAAQMGEYNLVGLESWRRLDCSSSST